MIRRGQTVESSTVSRILSGSVMLRRPPSVARADTLRFPHQKQIITSDRSRASRGVRNVSGRAVNTAR